MLHYGDNIDLQSRIMILLKDVIRIKYQLQLQDMKRYIRLEHIFCVVLAVLLSTDFYQWPMNVTEPLHIMFMLVHIGVAVHMVATGSDTSVTSALLFMTGIWNLGIHMTTSVKRDMATINLSLTFALQDLAHNFALACFIHVAVSRRLSSWCYIFSAIGMVYHIAGALTHFDTDTSGWTRVLMDSLCPAVELFKPYSIDKDATAGTYSQFILMVRNAIFHSDVTVLTTKMLLLCMWRSTKSGGSEGFPQAKEDTRMRITAQLPLNEVVTRRAELVAALHHAMDETLWHKGKEEGGITVEYGHPVFHHGDQPCEVEGFHIVSEESGITLDDVASYFHDACHFADTSNSMGTRSQIIAVRGAAPKIDDYEALVRTGFQLPPPLQNREFLHYVTSMRTTDRHGRPCIIFAYHSFLSNSTTFEGEAIPPQWDGYYRCPQYPSGQRATLLKNGNIRIEHCMTYSLKGKIGKWVQNNLFHYGHLDAYYNEWAKAMQVLRQEGKTSPASSATTETRKKGIELYKNVGSFKMPRGYEE